jgi:hypothetical protein
MLETIEIEPESQNYSTKIEIRHSGSCYRQMHMTWYYKSKESDSVFNKTEFDDHLTHCLV